MKTQTTHIDIYSETWTPGGVFYTKHGDHYELRTERTDSGRWVFVEKWFRGWSWPDLGCTKVFACKTDQEGKIVEKMPIREWDPHASLRACYSGRKCFRVLQLPSVE